MVFVLDNYDSFTYNLVQYIGELAPKVGANRANEGGSTSPSSLSDRIVVKRNDEVTPEEIVAMRPDRILLSPGPCTPQDAGILIPLLQHLAALPQDDQIPLLGVCLGHQALGAAFGGHVIRAPHLMHGKTSPVVHDGRGVFRDLPQPMTCTRYHSLIVEEDTLPACLEVSAWTQSVPNQHDPHDDSIDDHSPDDHSHEHRPLIMGLRHRSLPLEGVQFHPESVLTDHGKRLIENFLRQ